MSEAFQWVKLILDLGKAVLDAVNAGEDHKTVGEIFAGVGLDRAEIDRLEAEAAKHYGAK